MIKVDPSVRCRRIYPVEDNLNRSKNIGELKTVGIKLTREQAVHLARVFLAAAQDWDEIDMTAFASLQAAIRWHLQRDSYERGFPLIA